MLGSRAAGLGAGGHGLLLCSRAACNTTHARADAFQGDERTCRTCKSHSKSYKCSVCNEQKLPAELDRGQLDNHIKYRRELVCLGCADRGYTMRDMQGYRCSVCCNTYGRKLYQDSDIRHLTETSKAKLKCASCKQDRENRIKHLRRKVTADSSTKCTCQGKRDSPAFGTHRDKCPLKWWGAEAQTWPGKREGVTEEDRAYLDIQRPTWWLRRLGKKTT